MIDPLSVNKDAKQLVMSLHNYMKTKNLLQLKLVIITAKTAQDSAF